MALLCRVVALAPSTYYYGPGEPGDLDLRAQIEEIALEFPRYGYRRMTAELKRRQVPVNHKRVLRLMREGCVLVPIRQYCRSTTNSRQGYGRYPNLIKTLEMVRPDQVWCADLTYIRLESEFIYLAVILDVFTRAIRGWKLARHLTEELSKAALEQALESHRPEIHHSEKASAVCGDGLHPAAGSGPHPDQHGSRGPANRKCLCRALDADAEARKRSICMSSATWKMRGSIAGASSMRCTCTSGCIRPWAMSHLPSTRPSGMRSTSMLPGKGWGNVLQQRGEERRVVCEHFRPMGERSAAIWPFPHRAVDQGWWSCMNGGA